MDGQSVGVTKQVDGKVDSHDSHISDKIDYSSFDRQIDRQKKCMMLSMI